VESDSAPNAGGPKGTVLEADVGVELGVETGVKVGVEVDGLLSPGEEVAGVVWWVVSVDGLGPMGGSIASTGLTSAKTIPAVPQMINLRKRKKDSFEDKIRRAIITKMNSPARSMGKISRIRLIFRLKTSSTETFLSLGLFPEM